MSNVTKLVQRIAKLAKATVDQNGLVHEAVVLSKNPDGTLNVDDGTGGCIRIENFTNARIGQKIRIGLAPPPGTQTDDPPRFFDLPPFDIPPEFPPETPSTDDTLIYSYETVTWGADNIHRWGEREDYGTIAKVGGGFYNHGYFGNFGSADRTGNTLVQTYRYPHSVSDVPGFSSYSLEYGFSRVLYTFPPLNLYLDPFQAIKNAWIDVSLEDIHARTADARISVWEWQGFGVTVGHSDVESIDYLALPYGTSEPALNAGFLNKWIGQVRLGELALAGQTKVGLYPAVNRIPLNAYGIAALRRSRPTILAFLMDFNYTPPTRGTSSPLADVWQPWVGELPGRHAPRILASGEPTPQPYNQLRLRLKLEDA